MKYYIDPNTGERVNLPEYVQPLDSTLTYDNKAASAKVVGDKIRILEKNIESIGIIETTVSKLRNLSINNGLTPGQRYKITDYTCTTVQKDSRAIDHPFDLIVIALTTNKLDENARACIKDDDTYYSSDNCKSNLNAWEVKYSLFDDTNRFAWADTINGKGVIYLLKDDWGNECPYDFKQIQFKRHEIIPGPNIDVSNQSYLYSIQNQPTGISVDLDSEVWFYTFSWLYDDNSVEDLSTVQYMHKDDVDSMYHCANNIVKSYYTMNYITEPYTELNYLNNNVFIYRSEYDTGFFYGLCDNIMHNNCYNNTIYESSYNTFDGNSSNNFICNAEDNHFGMGFYNNIVNSDFINNSIGSSCGSNVFMHYCAYLTISNNFTSNFVKSSSINNIIGASCGSCTFDKAFSFNKIGNNVYGIEVVGICQNCNIGNNVRYLKITNTTTSSSRTIKNYTILDNTSGTSSSKLTINAQVNLTSNMFVGLASGTGTAQSRLKQWQIVDQAATKWAEEEKFSG